MDWKNKTFALFGIVVLLCGLFSSCGTEQKQSIQFFSMDTIMQITAYGPNAETGLSAAKATIETLSEQLNATQKNSALSQLHSGDTVSTFIQYPLKVAKQLGALTDASLDVRLYNLTDAWGFYTKAYKVPESVEIQSILDNRGTWDLNDSTFTCTEGTKLDLGSLAKGYAAEKAVETLKNSGVTSAILSLGGNVQTLGQKPDGSLWTVSITDPISEGGTVGDLKIGQSAVVTSGSYQRYFEQNGKIYHHILDPKTGYPVKNNLLSVTVLCKDGTVADGLSTALFVLGIEDSIKLYHQGDISFEAIFITKNQEIYLTQGANALFTQTNETYKPAKVLS